MIDEILDNAVLAELRREAREDALRHSEAGIRVITRYVDALESRLSVAEADNESMRALVEAAKQAVQAYDDSARKAFGEMETLSTALDSLAALRNTSDTGTEKK